MVLGDPMKRAAYLITGAIAGLVCGTILSIPFNYWYTATFVRSDDDSNFLVSALLFGFWPVFTLAGGAVGHLLYRRNLTSRSTGRAKKRRAG